VGGGTSNPVPSAFGRRSDLRRTQSAKDAMETLKYYKHVLR
jgi:hypothetical protein